MNLVGQGSIYVVLTVKHFWAVQKPVTSWNAEGKWEMKKMMKMMNFIKEAGKVLLVGVVTIAPFALHVLGVI
jgi:hypothetical protein